MDDPLLLWSRALRGIALIVLLAFGGPMLLISLGWFVVSWEDIGGNWGAVFVPVGLSLLLWLLAGLLQRKARSQK